MIHLTLLHPIKNTPVQHWTFKDETVVRIGRGTDNQVILYSAVVSRHHAELRCNGSTWEIINLGTNGTYLDGKRITQVAIADGIVLRLARSGPKIQIRFGDDALQPVSSVESVPLSGSLMGLTPESAEAGALEKTMPGPHPPIDGQMTSVPSTQQVVTDVERSSDHFFPITDPDLVALPQPAVTYSVSSVSSSPATVALASKVASTTHGEAAESPSIRFDLETGKPLHILQQIGDYQVMDVLGQGRVAVTYLAWRNGQTLALKTVNADWLGDSEAVALFEHEAQILQRLHHPNIPQFVDFFSIAGQPYLAMEMIYGQTLTQYVQTYGKVSIGRAISWILEVCHTLSYLHSLSPPILHRNLRPNNLILRTKRQSNHEIAVMDVGAARVVGLEADTHLELESYAAPEQQDGYATAASDLYALGPILVHLLTGQLPNRFYRYIGEEFRLSLDFIPDSHAALRTVLTTVTNPKPEQRYSSAKELATALQQALSSIS